MQALRYEVVSLINVLDKVRNVMTAPAACTAITRGHEWQTALSLSRIAGTRMTSNKHEAH